MLVYGRQLEALIPPMTSNTTPMGEASADSELTSESNKAWCAFNGNDNTNGWSNKDNNLCNGSWIQYKFDKPTNVKKLKTYLYSIIKNRIK